MQVTLNWHLIVDYIKNYIKLQKAIKNIYFSIFNLVPLPKKKQANKQNNNCQNFITLYNLKSRILTPALPQNVINVHHFLTWVSPCTEKTQS